MKHKDKKRKNIKIFQTQTFKFSTRILIGILIPIFITCISLGSYMIVKLNSDALKRINGKGHTINKLLAKISVIPIITHDYWSLEEYIQEVLTDDEIIYAVILNKKNKALTTTSAKPQDFDSKLNKTYSTPIFYNKMVLGKIEIGISTKSYRSERQKSIAFFLLITMGTICFCCFIAYLISTAVTRPLKKMITTMKKVEAGDFNVRQEVERQDEIGSLANGFNEMLEQLQMRERELDMHRSHLEEKVLERTKEINRANEQLKREQQNLEDLFNAAPAGMLLLNEKLLVAATNSAMDEMLDKEPGSMIGQRLGEAMGCMYCLDDERGCGFGRACPTCLLSNNIKNIFKTDEWLDGMELQPDLLIKGVVTRPWFDLRGHTVVIDGQKNVVLSIINISKRKNAEHRLKESQEELLQVEKLALVGQMSGMVAHEVLNPVSAISVRISLNLKNAQEITKVINPLNQVLKEWKTRLRAGEFERYFVASGKKDLLLIEKIGMFLAEKQIKRIEDLEFLDKQIHRVIRIIDGLREMSRHKKTIENIQIDQLLHEVIEAMGDGLTKRGIEVIRNFTDVPNVLADFMEIYSIFSNIIKNSMQAIDKLTQPAVKRITIELEKDDSDLIVIMIKDSGIGMDETTIDSLFQSGFTTKGREGTGLGLCYARKIARQYNGDLTIVESKPGKGATFKVVFNTAREDIEQ